MKLFEGFLDVFSDSTWQLFFKKPPLVEFCCIIKEEWVEKAVKTHLHFLTVYLIFLYTSTKTTYCNILKAEADRKIQLSSFKPDIEEIWKNNLKHHSSH